MNYNVIILFQRAYTDNTVYIYMLHNECMIARHFKIIIP